MKFAKSRAELERKRHAGPQPARTIAEWDEWARMANSKNLRVISSRGPGSAHIALNHDTCPECYAIVENLGAHEFWHRKMDP